MGLGEFLSRWRTYAFSGRHEVCFVKYENFHENWDNICQFLEIPADSAPSIEGFAPRNTGVDKQIAEIFASTRNEIAKWPSFEYFPQHDNQTTDIVRADPSQQVTVDQSTFTPTNLNAGAADAIARIGLIYDVLSSFTTMKFLLPTYNNYHSPDLDFFELFGLYQQFETEPNHVKPYYCKDVSLTEVVYNLLYDDTRLQNQYHYRVKADLYENDPKIQWLKAYRPMKISFLRRLSYTPRENIFDRDSDRRLAVLHLRREDICGRYLFQGVDLTLIPEHLKRGVQHRSVLTLENAVRRLERELPYGAKVDLVITSDGFGRIRSTFQKYPSVQQNIDRMEQEIFSAVGSDKLHVTSIRRIIGSDTKSTIATLDAMHQADIIVSSSSSFPRLPCITGGAKFLVASAE